MRTAVFGGTFNPPHEMHKRVAEMALEVVDTVVIVPNNVSPFKSQPEVTGAQRMDMCRLAFLGGWSSDRISISDFELAKSGKSFTYQTVEHFAACTDELFFVLGGDSMLDICEWARPDVIARHCTLLVVERKGIKRERLQAAIDRYKSELGGKVQILGACPDVSSSELRIALGFGYKPKGISDSVYDYINKNGLYTDLMRLTADFKTYGLSNSRIGHVFRVTVTADRLARFWGVNPKSAVIAAALHDIAKNMEVVRQRFDLPDLSSITEKCRHGFAGAEIAKVRYGIADEDILNAIRYHTTGRAGMSDLEKIVNIADYIEPGRDFDGLDSVRKLAYKSLNQCMLSMLKKTLKKLQSANAPIDKLTLETVESLEAEEQTSQNNTKKDKTGA